MKKNLAGNEKGFTLIELIIIIVVLGILAAVAVPKYVDIKTDAQKAAANGVLGGAQGATAVNFAGTLLKKAGVTKITNATTLVGAMDGGLPTGWAKNDTDTDCLGAKGALGAVSGASTTSVGCLFLDVDGTSGLSATDYIINIDSAETDDARAVLSKFGAAY